MVSHLYCITYLVSYFVLHTGLVSSFGGCMAQASYFDTARRPVSFLAKKARFVTTSNVRSCHKAGLTTVPVRLPGSRCGTCATLEIGGLLRWRRELGGVAWPPQHRKRTKRTAVAHQVQPRLNFPYIVNSTTSRESSA
eukprot:COSAG03_NODE_439_length_7918_cov_13.498785_5_plen_138_part_00